MTNRGMLVSFFSDMTSWEILAFLLVLTLLVGVLPTSGLLLIVAGMDLRSWALAGMGFWLLLFDVALVCDLRRLARMELQKA